MITRDSYDVLGSTPGSQITDDLDALLGLAEEVTSRLDDIDERRYRIRTKMLTHAVTGCIGFVIVVGVGAAAETLGTLDHTLRMVSVLASLVTSLAFVGLLAIALIQTRREQNKLAQNWRREYRLQQHLFSFIDQHMARLVTDELPSVKFSIALMRLQRLHRPNDGPSFESEREVAGATSSSVEGRHL